MAKKVVKAAPAKTPEPAKAPAKAKAPSTALVIPVLKPGAMSLDVGPIVLAAIGAYKRDERQIEELRKSVVTKEYEALARTTAGIVKAAKADNSIRLETVFSGDKAAKARLNNQIYLALGLKESVPVYSKKGEDTGKVQFTWTKAAAALVQPDKDDAPEVATQKGTIRTNLATMLTKCEQAAIGIIDDNLTITPDKASGTLMLTGPAMQKHFGAASVVLNEKQTVPVKDKKGEVIGEKKLNAKPSFTEIARRAAEAHGKVHQARVDSRVGATVDPNKHIADLCGMVLKALQKLTTPLADSVKTALESLNNAIDEKLA